MLSILKTMLLVSSASPTYNENESRGRRVVQRRLFSVKMEDEYVIPVLIEREGDKMKKR